MKSDEWLRKIEFPFDYLNPWETILEIDDFLQSQYARGIGCYKHDYLEVLINLANWPYPEALSEFDCKVLTEKPVNEKIYYEISPISNTLARLLSTKGVFSEDEWADYLSLKVYNISSIKGVGVDSDEFTKAAMQVVMCLIFDLSHKYSVPLEMLHFNDQSEEDLKTWFDDAIENLKRVDHPYFFRSYDIDLLEYYYQAINMPDSPFKYLAYYQVLECLFEEVHLHKTVQDVKSIITSSWFSGDSDEDIENMIHAVKMYVGANRDEITQLTWVLNEYFRADTHTEAHCLANSEIIEILRDRLKKIEKEEDICNTTKLTKIIYSYRNSCTHSSRKFPGRERHDKMLDYIDLIKKIVERVIINYSRR